MARKLRSTNSTHSDSGGDSDWPLLILYFAIIYLCCCEIGILSCKSYKMCCSPQQCQCYFTCFEYQVLGRWKAISEDVEQCRLFN
jgi:hypothetical protein